MVKPYQEQQLDNKVIREFAENTDELDLVWHRDAEDRTITPLQCEGWMFQYDNQKPFVMKVGESFFVEKNTFHRIIKGRGKLVVEIVK